jgi:hypothetical protein
MPMSLPYQGKDVSRQLERRIAQQEPVAATAASKVMVRSAQCVFCINSNIYRLPLRRT